MTMSPERMAATVPMTQWLMQQTPEDLQRITARTLAHYDQNAQSFWEGTRDHDVSQNIDALLTYIESAAPFELLDFGCGPNSPRRGVAMLMDRRTVVRRWLRVHDALARTRRT